MAFMPVKSIKWMCLEFYTIWLVIEIIFSIGTAPVPVVPPRPQVAPAPVMPLRSAATGPTMSPNIAAGGASDQEKVFNTLNAY